MTASTTSTIITILDINGIVIAPELEFTTADDSINYKGSFSSSTLQGDDGAVLREAFDISEDDITLCLGDFITGIGVSLDDDTIKNILNSFTLEELSFSYYTKRDGTYSVARFVADLSTISIELIYEKDTDGNSTTIFAIDASQALSLAELMPLIDPDEMPAFSLGMQISYASGDIDSTDITSLQSNVASYLLDDDESISDSFLSAVTSIKKGVALTPTLQMDGETVALQVPTSSTKTTTDVNGNTTTISNTTTDAGTAQQKPLGPVTISNFSAGYADGVMSLSLDGILRLSNILELHLLGLQISLDVDKLMSFDFSGFAFDLDGLYLSVEKGDLTIAGGLLRMTTDDGSTEYVGKVTVKTSTFTINTLGAYSQLQDGKHSILAYAAINAAIGGIPEFYVEGIALGFGYNRGVNLPSVDQLDTFPLITALSGDSTDTSTVSDSALATIREQFSSLSEYLPAVSGQVVIAAGLKFTTYKQVTTTAVAMVEFGNELLVHIVGLSSMTLPMSETGQSPIAKIEMAFRVSIMPESGQIQLEAQLTKNSYIFSEDCVITGGFAFYYWYGDNDNAGDFVVSIGGYHPKFSVPSHYPSVPRVGFRWRISDKLSCSGKMYIALTPLAIMAGGLFEATYEDDPVKAWFSAGMNFIIYWDPFYYEADFSITIGVEAKLLFTFETEIRADLTVYGPEFAGKATINWSVISFTIKFGDSSSVSDDPISWSTFKQRYIPDEDLVQLTITQGSLYQITDNDIVYHVVEPDSFELTINSQLPVNTVNLYDSSNTALDSVSGDDFHIAPTGAGDTVTDWTVNITVDDYPDGMSFTLEGIENPHPVALWGDSFQPSVTKTTRTKSLLSGITLTSSASRVASETELVSEDDFAYQEINCSDWGWGAQLDIEASEDDNNVIEDGLADIQSGTNTTYNSIYDYFGRDIDIVSVSTMKDNLSSAFIGTPQALTNTTSA